MPTPLVATPLRTLSIDPQSHPRGQPHLCAASGLICAHQRAYVIADDELHLAVFRDLHSPGELHRIFAGDLPRPKKARKRMKPDLETLVLLPSLDGTSNGVALLALGSGSRPNRNVGAIIPLDAEGEPSVPVRTLSLDTLYQPLREMLGEINIEGAMVLGDQLVLLNRGVPGRSDNAAARYPLRQFLEGIECKRLVLEPTSLRRYELGSIDGVPLAFTDGTALPDGAGWVFSAVAENMHDSYSDGPCSGSVVGVVDGCGDLLALHRLAQPIKVEGIAVSVGDDGIALCMVTDADDPAQSSQLLLARLPTAPAV
jgi:hypothetical protein